MEVYARALCALKVCNPTLCSIKKKTEFNKQTKKQNCQKNFKMSFEEN